MRNILVTGAAGFIGSNFVHYWMDKYPSDQVTVIDSLTYAGNIHNLDPVINNSNFKFFHANIVDQDIVDKVLVERKVDTIVHFAAESHVDRSITGPDEFIETNILGTYSLLKAAKNYWIDRPNSEGEKPTQHRFHHVSTDEVYGSLAPSDPPFTEETPYAPNSPYSASKAASDHLVRAYCHTYGLQVTTSNCSNNYGPYHFPEKLIPLVITNILQNKNLPIYGDGMQIRDWLYVKDHAYGIDLVLNKGLVGENYNIGGNNEWANINIVKEICKIICECFQEDSTMGRKFPDAKALLNGNPETLISYVKDRAGHDRRYAIDATKTNAELNYVPTESFSSGIKKTIEWYLTNDLWWKSILDGSYRNDNVNC